MRYQGIIFDLDGTLLDTLADLADSMNTTLEKNGFPGHGLEAYKYFVGDGMENLVRRALPAGNRDNETVARCVEGMREEYGRRWAEKTRPYPGVPEMLTEISRQGLVMAVLSNKPDDFTRMTVDKLLAEWRFDVVFGARPSMPKKPHPAGALEIAKVLNIPPSGFLYLGDTGTDMRTAVAAGMFPAGALWGFRTAGELIESGAKLLLEKPTDLLLHL